jgi:hypothetical protein
MWRRIAWVGLALIVICAGVVVSGGRRAPAKETPKAGSSISKIPADPPGGGALPPTAVEVERVVQNGEALYKYTVINGTAFPITGVLIGFDNASGQAELPMFDDATVPVGAVAPAGWHIVIQPTEEDSLGRYKIECDDAAHALYGGAVLNGIVIPASVDNTRYEGGHWTVYLDSPSGEAYTGLLVPPGASASVAAGPGGDWMRVGPNPSRGTVNISFSMRSASVPRVEIFDTQGRRVRELRSTTWAGGVGGTVWDCLDAAGGKVGAGVYFVRVKGDQAERFARVMLVR